jgi:thioredoxin reductase/Pyruvate/2-oxoacid:ferredoxin oxidoreductase delta subunit
VIVARCSYTPSGIAVQGFLYPRTGDRSWPIPVFRTGAFEVAGIVHHFDCAATMMRMDSLITLAIAAGICLFFLFGYLRKLKTREKRAQEAAKRGTVYSEGPRAQHPQIDANSCIGCATCTTVCPEGDVLAMLGGKAAIVNGYKCIGHSLCAEACPVGAITMVMASPGMSADLPVLSAQHETNVSNLFIAGELGGLALIKNAINQGRDCVDTVAGRINGLRGNSTPGVLDLLIVGAGPAGISSSLRAMERNLNYLTVEQDEIGGTVAKYPRQKLVMTSPVALPLYGKFKKMELSKEELIALWKSLLQRSDFNVRTGEKVEDIQKGADGIFTILSNKGLYRARAVILGLGRSGTPRRLGVKGEELPKVMYRLIETDHYINKRILVVGGGDSAIEAAMGLANQKGNNVTLSYRREGFARIKERNGQRVQEYMRSRKIQVLFNSLPTEFRQDKAVLQINGSTSEIPNDYVWIFAGGEPPRSFLEKIGVRLGNRDMTLEASNEAKRTLVSI